MESLVKVKEANCNGSVTSFVQSTTSAIANICSSDSLFPPHHQDLISANSIELNAAASLSDDSGVPLTTNSSISSGDSYRLGLCKFDIEIVESDGEVSQFDSLDNCSEGGMSAENFNTLKKGPLAPIDPPPEFQDSPQKTLVHSSKNVLSNLRRWTSSQSSFEHLKDHGGVEINLNVAVGNPYNTEDNGSTNCSEEKALKDTYTDNKYLYSSDSILNIYTDNMYDEPNDISTSFKSDSSSLPLPPPPPPVSIVKIKQTLCPHFQDHTKYFKAISSEQNITTHKFSLSGLSEIQDYDLYYGLKRSTCRHDSLQRKLMYSPLNNSHCHNHMFHGGACGNRPNSRNSVNSRLSSSHNSLSVSSANKPDDSIFITQAMSHDALLTREISDFYNVPIDSDIYAFPVDMIKTEKDCYNYHYGLPNSIKENKTSSASDDCTKNSLKGHQHKLCRKSRNKRKKRSGSHGSKADDCTVHVSSVFTVKRGSTFIADINDDSSDDLKNAGPLHMSLDEVKGLYHTLYSDPKSVESSSQYTKGLKGNVIKSTSEIIWGGSTIHARGSNAPIREKSSAYLEPDIRKLAADNSKTNNVALIKEQRRQQCHLQPTQTCRVYYLKEREQSPQMSSVGKKQNMLRDKKSQFALNLKQKFCSIFRFRKTHNRCRTISNETDESTANREGISKLSKSVEDKRKKFQSRALPPLPKKAAVDTKTSCEEKYNNRESFQFTSSIEKVKDYGWYWGPLSSEAAEKILSNEPDGSFIVRDSSDDHYIFSLSFKLNNCVRHVRIEQDQGTFSFGSYAKFKSQTITEFIEKAVEHSRSGRYLFFLHRRPEHGPMRVQLTNPVSRFKHVQSLQHMCRFVILKVVIRKDLIQTLPLPRRLLDYLNYKHCYSEQVESDSSHSQISGERTLD